MDKGDQGEDNLDKIAPDTENLEKLISIGADLDQEVKKKLISLFANNMDCFAWSHTDMTGISPDVIMHRLNVDLFHKPIKQKL